jgi:non-specific serine/threonine protein kinase
MLEQFDRRFQWLTQGARDLPAWRQTLQGAIEWSVQLLSDSERVLFQRLSVFSGGWTLEAAEEICSDESLCRREDIFNLLMQLTDKSLVLPENEDGHFAFLETLREYALTGLTQSGGLPALQARHCEYFLAFIEKASPHLKQGGDELKWLALVERERDNLRQALSWSTSSPERAESAMRLGHAIHIFWLTRGYIAEARAWLSKILALDSAPTTLRANLLRFASDFASSQGDYTSAHLLEEEAMNISKALGDEAGIYFSMDGMAMWAGMQGDYARTAELLHEVLDYRRRKGDAMLLTTTLNNLAIALRRLERLEESRNLYLEAIETNRKAGNSISLAHSLHGLADVYALEEDFNQAIPLQKDSLNIRVQLGNQKGIQMSLDALALSFWRTRKSAAAINLASAADWIRKEIGVSITPAVKAENEAFIAEMRAELGEEKFQTAWLDGQTMPLEQVVELVEQAS